MLLTGSNVNFFDGCVQPCRHPPPSASQKALSLLAQLLLDLPSSQLPALLVAPDYSSYVIMPKRGSNRVCAALCHIVIVLSCQPLSLLIDLLYVWYMRRRTVCITLCHCTDNDLGCPSLIVHVLAYHTDIHRGKLAHMCLPMVKVCVLCHGA